MQKSFVSSHWSIISTFLTFETWFEQEIFSCTLENPDLLQLSKNCCFWNVFSIKKTVSNKKVGVGRTLMEPLNHFEKTSYASNCSFINYSFFSKAKAASSGIKNMSDNNSDL